jgi:integrase
MKINKSNVDKLEIPVATTRGTAQKRYYDDSIKGFGVRVTSGGTKAFFIEKVVGRKLRRITLGRYGEITVEQAKKEAQKILGKIATGIDPVAEKQATRVRQVTLHEAFNDYLSARKSLKPKTLYDYKRVMVIAFGKWKDRALLEITKDNISNHHKALGAEHGEAYANLAMRLLRAIFNFAAGQYEDAQGRSLILENPVRRLSQTRAWYRVERKRTFIPSHKLGDWYQGVIALDNEVLKNYLLFILFTGLRRQEAAKIKWEKNVDLQAKTLTILDTKNHHPHTLPVSDFLYELLSKQKSIATNAFVFPGGGKAGHIVEPRRQMAKVTRVSGVEFTVHDLRRSFITAAESIDISAYALKRLMNHHMSGDVTAGYIMTDVERLRKPVQQITDFLCKCMGIKQQAAVITLAINERTHSIKIPI